MVRKQRSFEKKFANYQTLSNKRLELDAKGCQEEGKMASGKFESDIQKLQSEAFSCHEAGRLEKKEFDRYNIW